MILFVAGVIVAVAGVSEATICKNDTACAMGECCYIQPEFMVVSKRQLALPVLHEKHDTGVCESYKSPDDSCGPLEVLNGHCGCVSGYSCQWVPEPTVVVTKAMQARRRIYHDGPGTYKCTQTEATTP